MGAKKNAGGEQKKPDAGKKGGADSRISVVLKADFHCEGCVSKIVKAIRACDGVEDVKVDGATSKLTVTGKVDPAALREKVEAKTHRKVTVVSPEAANKVKDGGEKDKKKNNAKVKDGKPVEDSKGDDNDKKKKTEKDKPVAAAATAVLRMNLHCEGCIQKIQRIVSKTKGCQEMKMDKQKETVTVTGTMDVKALTESLKKHLKREVEVVAPPPKKEGGEKKEKGDGGEREKGKGGGKKEGGGGGGGGGGEKGKAAVEEGNRMQVQVGYPYVYGPGYVADPIYYNYPPAPQMFSDENPNACTIM